MEVNLYRPASAFLSNYIDGFYALERTPDEPPCSYVSFPGLHSIVCLYTNTVTACDDHTVRIRHEPNGMLESKIVGEFNQPAYISCMRGRPAKLLFYFGPLGLNAFLPRPLKDYTSGHFSDFEPFDDYLPTMAGIMGLQDPTLRIAALERYWESKFLGFSHPFLNAVVEKLTEGGEVEQGLADLASSFGVSRQLLHQQFRIHVLKGPSEFRKIVRFRQALAQWNKQQREKLTEISTFVNYFDQSHMIRDFKSVTGYTPKRFLGAVYFREWDDQLGFSWVRSVEPGRCASVKKLMTCMVVSLSRDHKLFM